MPKRNDILLGLVIFGVFAALAMAAHRDIPHFWAIIVLILLFSAGCLVLTRSRESLDIFLGMIAALFTLCAILMLTSDLSNPRVWLFFFGFTGAAALFVLFTKKKLQTLAAIAAIVGFRLLIFVVLYVLRPR